MMTLMPYAAALAVLCSACSQTNTAPASVAQLQRVDSIAAWYQANRSIPSLSVTVLRQGQTIVNRDYGSLPTGEDGATHAGDRFYGLGSIKKTATAVAVLHLAQRATLQLDDAVSVHTQSVQVPRDGPTVRQLLRHTSGFPQSSDNPRVEKLEFAPGSRWEYNNANFDKLDEVISTSSGHTLDELLSTVLAGDGLGMCEGERAPPGILPGHRSVGGELQPAEGPCWFFGTTTGLAGWINSVFSGDVIPLSAVTNMVAPTEIEGRRVPFGAGVALRPLRGVRRWSHTGHDNGSTAAFGYYPDQELTIAVAGNSEGFWDPDGLEMAIAEVLLSIPPQLPASSTAETVEAVEPGDFSAGPVTFQLSTSEDGAITLSMLSSADPDVVYVRTRLRPVGTRRYVGIDSPHAVEAELRIVDGRRMLLVHLVGIPWTATEN